MERSETTQFSMVNVPLEARVLNLSEKTFTSETTTCNVVHNDFAKYNCYAKNTSGFNERQPTVLFHLHFRKRSLDTYIKRGNLHKFKRQNIPISKQTEKIN